MRALHLHLLLLLLLLPLCAAELKFVQVWFRHGERSPTTFLHFPTDPPQAREYDGPLGELTRRGMDQEYTVGERLRERYGGYFGEFDMKTVRVDAGDDNRTISSALLAASALFPQQPDQVWREGQAWIPIPVHADVIYDECSFGALDSCSTLQAAMQDNEGYMNLINQIDEDVNWEEMKRQNPALVAYPSFLEYLRNMTGLELETPKRFQQALDTIKTKDAIQNPALPLPTWAKPIVPNVSAALDGIHRRMIDLLEGVKGMHIDKVFSFMEDQLARAAEKRTKGILIGAHDANMLTFGRAFDIAPLKEHLVHYGGSLAVELHEEKGEQYVKFFYANSFNDTLVETSSKECGKPCYLGRMQQIYEKRRVRPVAYEELCRGDASEAGVLSGSLIIAVAVLLLTSVVLLGTTCSYRKQLHALNDPERQRLILHDVVH